MSAGTYSQLPFTTCGNQSSTGQYLKVMIGLSLALHLIVLLLIAGLRLPGKTERPLAAYDVSLVTMPTPTISNTPPAPRPPEPEPVKTPEPPVARPTPVPKVTAPPPPQPVRLSPMPQARTLEPIPTRPAPVPAVPKPRQEAPPSPAPPAVARQSEPKPVQTPVAPPPRPVLNRDILRGIALPTEVPKLGQVTPIPAGTPKEAPVRAQTEMEKMLNNLAVPESAPTAAQQTTSSPARTAPSRSSMSEEVTRQLQKMEQMPPKVEPSKAAPTPESRVASKPVARTPVTALQANGVAAGNPYLALVQRKISEHWTAPQVGLSGEQFQVVVKFRLDKTGQVSGIVVERTSGNEYYDLAARRAVLSANPLPSFPPDMAQSYFDAHFSFAIGEPVS
jgi:colicin import membrane protein